MRISLISMFIVITSVAIMLWGLGKAAYYQRLISQAAIYVPRVANNEIAVTTISTSEFVISTGLSSKARISIIQNSASGPTTIEQSEKDDKFVLSIVVTNPGSKGVEIGFMLAGKTHTVPLTDVKQMRVGSNSSNILADGQQMVLLEVLTSPSSGNQTTYSVVIEAVDVGKAAKQSRAAATPKP